MSLEARKIEFVKLFLSIQNEKTISRLETALRNEKIDLLNSEASMFTKIELNQRIDQSESDFSQGKYKESSDLLSKYE